MLIKIFFSFFIIFIVQNKVKIWGINMFKKKCVIILKYRVEKRVKEVDQVGKIGRIRKWCYLNFKIIKLGEM